MFYRIERTHRWCPSRTSMRGCRVTSARSPDKLSALGARSDENVPGSRRLPARYSMRDIDWIAWAPPYDQLSPNPELAARIEGFRPVFTSNDYLVQLAAVEAGVGAMILGRAFHRRSRIKTLMELNLDLGPGAAGTFHLVVARRMADVPRIRLVAETILRELAPVPHARPSSKK